MDKNTLLQVWPIPAFDDNYIWCIHDGSNALVVDPGDAEPTLEYLKANKLTLKGILITHHHADHTGGILTLLEKLGANIPVYGPVGDNIPGRTVVAMQDDKIEIASPRISLKVCEVPGPTLSHIAYFAKPNPKIHFIAFTTILNMAFHLRMIMPCLVGSFLKSTKQVYHGTQFYEKLITFTLLMMALQLRKLPTIASKTVGV